MNISSFGLVTNRKRIFQLGSVMQLGNEVISFGKTTVLFTGGSSLEKSGRPLIRSSVLSTTLV